MKTAPKCTKIIPNHYGATINRHIGWFLISLVLWMFCQLQWSFEIDNFEKQRFFWPSLRQSYGFTSNSVIKAHLLPNRDPCYRLSPRHREFNFWSSDLFFFNKASECLLYGKKYKRCLKRSKTRGFWCRIFFSTQFPILDPRFKERERSQPWPVGFAEICSTRNDL